jgi:hypothetical protein
MIQASSGRALTDSVATNLYLYGSQDTPQNLNDRIRPVVAAADRPFPNTAGIGDPNLPRFEISVRIDEASFFTGAGPGRFASLANIPFLAAFFDTGNWGVDATSGRSFFEMGVGRLGLKNRVYFDEGATFSIQELRTAGFLGTPPLVDPITGTQLASRTPLYGQDLDHRYLSDITNLDSDYPTRTYTFLSQVFFVNDSARFIFSASPALRRVEHFVYDVDHEKFSFEGNTNATAAAIIENKFDPYRIGRNFRMQYTRDVEPRTIASAEFLAAQAEYNALQVSVANTLSGYAAGYAALTALADSLKQTGVIDIHHQQYSIVYVTSGSDDQLSIPSNKVDSDIVVPSVLVGGAGSDTFFEYVGVNSKILGGNYDDPL